MYQKLQKLCKQKNTNITKLCEQVTGSSGNLTTWKKGYMRSDYLAKAADILGVSTDYLLDRTIEPDDEKSSLSGLTENEREIVKIFKELTETQQGIIIGRALSLAEYNNNDYSNKERISL